MKKLILCLLLVCMLALSCACAQETAIGDIPRRGLILPITQEDTAEGFMLLSRIVPTNLDPQLPSFLIAYTDDESAAVVNAAYEGKDMNDPATAQAYYSDLAGCLFVLHEVVLIKDSIYADLAANGVTPADIAGDTAFLLGVNDGYTYIAYDAVDMQTYADDAQKARIRAAADRSAQWLSGVAFQPIVFAPGEIIEPVDAFPAFSTVDLDGNPVTNDVFSGKDLTVVNVWGTFCPPCINEMPQLEAWHQSMPENMQLIGLVSDVSNAEDAAALETARMICEMTGVTYTSLVANADFLPLLQNVTGVPTTFFVDSTGAVVGEPIVGADIKRCIAAAEALLNEQK